MSVLSSTTEPRRGRPPQTEAEAQVVRQRIVTAAGEVFAEHGSRGLSVARIIENAGIARPTFYRYFGNALEPLHVLLDDSDNALVSGIVQAVEHAGTGVEIGIAVIDAYLAWANDRGRVLRPLFAELHDQASPVSTHREIALDQLRTVIRRKLVEQGRPELHPLDLDTLIQACEFIGYRLTLDEPDDALIAHARSTMIRICLAVVGEPDDYALALAQPAVLFGNRLPAPS